MLRGLALIPLTVAAAAAVPAGAAATPGSRLPVPVEGFQGVVVSESPAASRLGRAARERGGNAVDAAAAMVFGLGVGRPQSCGIGGGGFAVYRSRTGEVRTLDFRETAPAAFTPTTLEPPGLHKTFTGHLTVGVPGVVAGMDALVARYGRGSPPMPSGPPSSWPGRASGSPTSSAAP